MTDAVFRVGVFVYFTADSADDARVMACLTAHREALARDRIHLRFWRRIEGDRPGQTTWMESVESPLHSSSSLVARIDRSAQTVGLSPFARGERHVELFEALTP